MIKSFRSAEAEAEALFGDRLVTRFLKIERPARRKLLYLSQARSQQDLLVPPGNRLKALKGEGKGQHSIRINDQWHTSFRWLYRHAYDRETVDYHG